MNIKSSNNSRAIRNLLASLALASFLACPMVLTACGNDSGDSAQTIVAEDGEHSIEVQLEGGSGRASVTTPCKVTVEDGKATATIEWSSPNYDKMVVGDQEYAPINDEGNSQFEIPIPSLNCDLAISAETTAMSQPHMIEYTLRFGEGQAIDEPSEDTEIATGSTTLVEDFHDTNIGCDLGKPEAVSLEYAREFTIDRFNEGYALICMADGSRHLVVPEGKDAPSGLSDDVSVVSLPIENAYVAAQSMFCLIDALDGIDAFALCSTQPDDCSVENFSKAIESGKVAFGGKYNAPDYELITATGCKFALESTMINHSPKVKRQLEDLGLVVMTELSSYEPDPRGRLEWIKALGLLLGREDLAQEIFDQQIAQIDKVQSMEATGKKVAFFYVNSNGSAVVRKSGDYVPAMIAMAGGEYAFSNIGDDTATSTATIDMESFFATAKDADVLIYNATIDNSVASIDDLIAKNKMFAQFKAVEEGNVWITDQDMYQQMVNTGSIVSDMHEAFAGNIGELTYLKKID